MTKEKKWSIPQLVIKIFAVVMFVFGVLLTAYPFYSDVLNDALASKVSNEYLSTENQKYRRAQNAKLRAEQRKKISLKDPFSKVSLEQAKQEATHPPTAFLIKHTIAIVYIPKINQKLPVFDTINDIFMDRGATWMSQTDVPGSGVGKHTVITAHRGLPSASLFTDLNKLEKGDRFIIEVDGKYLAYEVYTHYVVTPDDTSKIKRIPGQDTVTLLTCTPYMVNSHRLLVVGKRVPFTPSDQDSMGEIADEHQVKVNRLVLGLSASGMMSIVLLYLAYLRFKHSRKTYDLKFRVLGKDGHPVTGAKYQLFDRWGRKPKKRNGLPIISEVNPLDGTVDFKGIPGVTFKIKQVAENSIYHKLPDFKIGILKRKATNFTVKIKERNLKGMLNKIDDIYNVFLDKK